MHRHSASWRTFCWWPTLHSHHSPKYQNNYEKSYLIGMSRDMTKPTKWVCAQRRLRSAWASAQSDQSLRCPQTLWETLSPSLPFERTVKTLIRLGGCPGWSESSLGAHSLCWFCHVVARILATNRTFFVRGNGKPRNNPSKYIDAEQKQITYESDYGDKLIRNARVIKQ